MIDTPLDTLGEIGICFESIGDLMSTDSDSFQDKQRDNLAVLMGFLQRQYNEAYNQHYLEVHQQQKAA